MKVSDKKLQAVIRWTPHDKQKEVLRVNDNMRITVIDAGRRFGKSALCAYIALKVLLQPNKKVWIVAPTYDLTLKVFNYLVRWFSICTPSQAKGITYKPYPKIHTAHNSILECKSSENPTSLLGEELDLIIVDEASRIPKNIWEAYLFPTTSSRQGRVVFISTPKGKNWFYYEWLRAKELGGAFMFPSSCNPTFKKEEWEYAKGRLPQDVFSQEYEAAFLDDAARVFRGIKDIVDPNCLADVIGGRHYLLGVDLAKRQDFTVLTVIDTFNNKVVHIDRFNEIDWNMQKSRIIALARRYNNARVIMDSTGVGDPISDDLKREGLLVDDFRYTNKSKQQLVEKLSLYIEQGLIRIPDNNILIDELESFGYNMTDGGRIVYGAPEGFHDDCVNSLGLAVWGIQGAVNPKTELQLQLQKGMIRKNRSVF